MHAVCMIPNTVFTTIEDETYSAVREVVGKLIKGGAINNNSKEAVPLEKMLWDSYLQP